MRPVPRFLCAFFLFAASIYAAATEKAVLRNGFSIRHERREQIGDTVRLYLGLGPDSGYVDVPCDQITSYEPDAAPAIALTVPEQTPAPAPRPFSMPELHRLVSDAGGRHSIDPDLIDSVIRAESNFNYRAKSPKGAQGLMQLMPGTAARLGVADPYQPDANVDAGTRYLRELLVRYNNDVVKALAAYNAGPQRVEHYRGVPPYRETHTYVARVVHDFNRKKLANMKSQAESKRNSSVVAGTAAGTKPAKSQKPAPATAQAARSQAHTSGGGRRALPPAPQPSAEH
jgi:hypothetical protein